MASSFRIGYITVRQALAPQPLLPRIVQATRAGVDLIQIREKDLPTRALIDVVRSALAEARGSASRIVVNDRLDVALALAADGVHLGTHSMPGEVVRAQVAKDFLVGISCHSLAEAQAAESAGADYVLLGPIFETPSKQAYGPPLGLVTLREVTARIKTPVLALGGITVERVRPCLRSGAAGIAAVRLFQGCESLEERVRELRAQFAP